MMLNGDHSDVTITVKGEEFKLHKSLLSARSPFFKSMFESNMKENITGLVTIEDCEAELFRSFITFLYTGEVYNLTSESIYDLYQIADKYQDKQLKEECLQFMIKNFCVDTFCEVIAFAVNYKEKVLFQKASEFFCMKMKKIIQSEKWEVFLREYPTQANELFKEGAEFFVDE